MINDVAGANLLIPNGGTRSNIYFVNADPLVSLQVPLLTSCTLTVSGCCTADPANFAASGALVPICNNAGVQILTFAATLGNFVLGSGAFQDVAGLYAIQIGSSVAQGADRTFILTHKTPNR